MIECQPNVLAGMCLWSQVVGQSFQLHVSVCLLGTYQQASAYQNLNDLAMLLLLPIAVLAITKSNRCAGAALFLPQTCNLSDGSGSICILA